MNSFRTTVFDPSRVIGQMLCLQSIFYSMETMMMFAWSFNGYQPSLDHIFSLEIPRPMTIIQLASVFCCAAALPLLVGRAKQCFDFAFTLHFIHFIVCCVYNWSIPLQFTWYRLQLISISVCAVLGEYLCMRMETMEIPLTNGPSKVFDA